MILPSSKTVIWNNRFYVKSLRWSFIAIAVNVVGKRAIVSVHPVCALPLTQSEISTIVRDE